MQCYIYSCQDLILKGNTSEHIKAGEIYCLNFDNDEDVFVYSACQGGVMVINANTIVKKSHNQINFYDLSSLNILCEIKPFQALFKHIFAINKSTVKLVEVGDLYIYFNNTYYGRIQVRDNNPTFEKISKHGKDYGIIKFDKTKHMIFFSETEILYCGKYLDYEILNQYIQIYEHVPNVFNIGKLFKYNFDTEETGVICVNDRGILFTEQNKDFMLEYFMEALKCERYRYAYDKLSYELRADISIDALKLYFKRFDAYKYIDKTNTYITFYNGKVSGVYRFEINQNLIDNIY